MSEETEKVNEVMNDFHQKLDQFGRVVSEIKSEILSQEPYQGLFDLVALGYLVSKRFSEVIDRDEVCR